MSEPSFRIDEAFRTAEGHHRAGDLEAEIEAKEEAIREYEPGESNFAFEIRAQRLLGDERVVRVGAGSVGIPYQQCWLEATILRPDLIAGLQGDE